ncbi:MAG: hypothetical protein WA459_22925 [Stellaceae bacterium]
MRSDADKWRQGIPLKDADWHFASARLCIEYDEVQNLPHDKAKSMPANIDEALRNFQKSVEPQQKKWEILNEMRQTLLERLTNGTLIAYGFRIENGIARDQVEEIPPFMFKMSFVGWFDSSLKGLGHQFDSVRVVRPERRRRQTASVLPTPVEAVPARNAIGRPSKGHLIQDAIAALYAQGIDLSARSSAQVGGLVRGWIAALSGKSAMDSQGLSNETIRRVHVKYKERDCKNVIPQNPPQNSAQ